MLARFQTSNHAAATLVPPLLEALEPRLVEAPLFTDAQEHLSFPSSTWFIPCSLHSKLQNAVSPLLHIKLYVKSYISYEQPYRSWIRCVYTSYRYIVKSMKPTYTYRCPCRAPTFGCKNRSLSRSGQSRYSPRSVSGEPPSWAGQRRGRWQWGLMGYLSGGIRGRTPMCSSSASSGASAAFQATSCAGGGGGEGR